MAKKAKTQNDVRSLKQKYPKWLEHFFRVIWYIR